MLRRARRQGFAETGKAADVGKQHRCLLLPAGAQSVGVGVRDPSGDSRGGQAREIVSLLHHHPGGGAKALNAQRKTRCGKPGDAEGVRFRRGRGCQPQNQRYRRHGEERTVPYCGDGTASANTLGPVSHPPRATEQRKGVHRHGGSFRKEHRRHQQPEQTRLMTRCALRCSRSTAGERTSRLVRDARGWLIAARLGTSGCVKRGAGCDRAAVGTARGKRMTPIAAPAVILVR